MTLPPDSNIAQRNLTPITQLSRLCPLHGGGARERSEPVNI